MNVVHVFRTESISFSVFVVVVASNHEKMKTEAEAVPEARVTSVDN